MFTVLHRILLKTKIFLKKKKKEKKKKRKRKKFIHSFHLYNWIFFVLSLRCGIRTENFGVSYFTTKVFSIPAGDAQTIFFDVGVTSFERQNLIGTESTVSS